MCFLVFFLCFFHTRGLPCNYDINIRAVDCIVYLHLKLTSLSTGEEGIFRHYIFVDFDCFAWSGFIDIV